MDSNFIQRFIRAIVRAIRTSGTRPRAPAIRETINMLTGIEIRVSRLFINLLILSRAVIIGDGPDRQAELI